MVVPSMTSMPVHEFARTGSQNGGEKQVNRAAEMSATPDSSQRFGTMRWHNTATSCGSG